MIHKIKQSRSEKILLFFLISLFIFSLGSFFIIKNKCLFIKDHDPNKIKFIHPENIAILRAPCGNVIIELYPNISPNSVKRFKMLIERKEYDNVAFHRVIKNVLVQSGDTEYGKRESLNYAKIGNGKSKYGTINTETDNNFDFEKGTVAMARTYERNSEDTQFLEESWLTNLRQQAAAKKASESLEIAQNLLQQRTGEEFVAAELRRALNALGDIVGQTTADDLLSRVFAEFCIGK